VAPKEKPAGDTSPREKLNFEERLRQARERAQRKS
jgi:hypothetical protein